MRLPGDDSEADESLVARFRRGDRDAFDRIVARYRGDVYRIARRLTASHEDADDVAQETFLRAHGALTAFRGESALKTWLFRIAINLAAGVGRSRSRRRFVEHDFAADALHVEAGVGTSRAGHGAERSVLREESDGRVRTAIDRLARRQRQVVVLRVYEEMKFHEIAELLDCPLGTVKANFFHAMTNLKKVLR